MSRLRTAGICLGAGAVGTLTGVGASLPYSGWTAAVMCVLVGGVVSTLLGAAIGASLNTNDTPKDGNS